MKKIIYIFLTIFLGFLLSIIAHSVIEIIYLKIATSQGWNITWYSAFGKGQCALHSIVQWLLIIAGIIWGYYIGKSWWRYVYIEKKHWRFKK